jgi:hypothetical protein
MDLPGDFNGDATRYQACYIRLHDNDEDDDDDDDDEK